MNDKKYKQYLKMVNFLNNVLPMLINDEQYELCRKYMKEGSLSQEDLKKLCQEK